MAKYLHIGIPVKISVLLKDNCQYNIDLEKELDLVTEKIEKYIDLSNYNGIIYRNGYDFIIDTDYINKHLFEFIKELNNYFNVTNYFIENYLDKNNKDLSLEDINISMGKYDNSYKYESKWEREKKFNTYYLNINNNYIDEEIIYHFTTGWLFSDSIYLNNCFKITIAFCPLWMNFIDSFYDSSIIIALNNLKNKAFESELGKVAIFTIY